MQIPKMIRPLCVLLVLLSACATSGPGPGGDVAVDGVAEARVFTWHDLDGDGVYEEGEPPLPWVTVSIAFPDALTGEDGRAQLREFRPGCASQCWEGLSVAAKVPPGYAATTEKEMALTGQGHSYEFGFELQDAGRIPEYPGEPSWYRAFEHRGARVLDFHYAEPEAALRLDLGSVPEDGYYAQDYVERSPVSLLVLDVLLTLVDEHDVVVTTLDLALVPSERHVTCEVEALRDAYGQLPGEEILEEHCAPVP